jgi:hypothetical protein
VKTKVAVLVSGALIALLLLVRYFALSRAGVLFALRLINLGAGWTTQTEGARHNGGVGGTTAPGAFGAGPSWFPNA